MLGRRTRVRARDRGRERDRDAGAERRLEVLLDVGRRAVLFAMAARPQRAAGRHSV
jgi:hypothetical protein